MSAYPGQVLSLNVTGIDEFRQPVTLTVRVSDVSVIIQLVIGRKSSLNALFLLKSL